MPTRRQLIQNALVGAGGLAIASLYSCTNRKYKKLSELAGKQVYDPELNMYRPEHCAVRIVARSSYPVIQNHEEAYIWHSAPDGGACFEADNGGWVYVSNCELPAGDDWFGKGGVGALRFDAQGNVVDAYSILSNTKRNCAGGKTPWGTWLSCEESGEDGQVYECDPMGKQKALVRPAMGSFNHEAVAYEKKSGYFYLTEDKADGGLYRFKPSKAGDLSEGGLEVGVSAGEWMLDWQVVPDPSASEIPCRKQVQGIVEFRGGEGIAESGGVIYFATKKDNRVWAYDTETSKYNIVYAPERHAQPILTGVDNVEIAPSGEILVAEDGGDMQIVVLDTNNTIYPLLTILGQDNSEICGPAFSPDNTRLYFSSQRGTTGKSRDGITYEIQFPFPV